MSNFKVFNNQGEFPVVVDVDNCVEEEHREEWDCVPVRVHVAYSLGPGASRIPVATSPEMNQGKKESAMKKKHESVSLENCRHSMYCGMAWLGRRSPRRTDNAMCWDGAVAHGVPAGWEGTVSVALTQFPNKKGHRVLVPDGDPGRYYFPAVRAGSRTFTGTAIWLWRALSALSEEAADGFRGEFYVSFKGRNGRYVPCPWGGMEKK